MGLQSFSGREGAGEMLSAQASHKHQGASYTLTTPALSVVPKIQSAFVKGRARKERALPVPNWKKPVTAESGAAEVCLQPGRIGLWMIRAKKDPGTGP